MYHSLYLLRFNNYYNRKLKRFERLEEYEEYLLNDIIINVNFVTVDGVMAEQVINWNTTEIPDYMLAVNQDDNTFTRWFVIEAVRTRTGQYRLTLRRDLLADFYKEFSKSTAMIEKGTLKNSDPFIYLNEGQQYNQIKQSETPLKDETNSAWVVGYIPKDYPEKDTEVTASYESNDSIFKSYSTIDEVPFKDFLDKDDHFMQTDYKFRELLCPITAQRSTLGGSVAQSAFVRAKLLKSLDGINFTSSGMTGIDLFVNSSENRPLPNSIICNAGFYAFATPKQSYESYKFMFEEIAELSTDFDLLRYVQYFKRNLSNYYNNLPYQEFDGKIIEIANNKYRVTFKYVEATPEKLDDSDELKQLINNHIGGVKERNKPQFGGPNYATIKSISNYQNLKGIINKYEVTKVSVVLEPANVNVKLTIPAAKTRQHLVDQPFDMFCMPYSDDVKIRFNLEESVTSIKNLSLALGQDIARQLGSQSNYDVQLLPYFPAREYLKPGGAIDVTDGKYTLVTNPEGTNKVGIVIWCQKSTFTFDIASKIVIDNPKQQSNTDMWRLCSPNYAGLFEFNAAKNKGVSKYNVDCTYQPFNPYIHINPEFKGLYGKDFNDSRGLICSGDFSLPQLSNKWADYQLNNKNYQQTFDRQIQSMDVLHDYSQQKLVFGTMLGLGASAAGIGGAIASENKLGAVLGGVGAASSVIGGIGSAYFNEKVHNENRDKAIDEFNFNLQNIKAIPSSLTKTTALTANNKIFPFVEYYTCSAEEKEAFENKIKWTGMTIMRVGHPRDYFDLSTYLQGSIIRIEIEDDFHLVKELADEFSKGIYLGGDE